MAPKKSVKYIFVLGGVISGLGKGIAAASIGYLLKGAGLKVTILKLDPYLNVDPGTMNPYQHGEVFVLDDGSETDLDLGHYERFIDVDMQKINNATTGQVYSTVLEEKKGRLSWSHHSKSFHTLQMRYFSNKSHQHPKKV